MEAGTLAAEMVTAIRRRKGLNEKLVLSSDFEDDV
jgi:hypothetical protein